MRHASDMISSVTNAIPPYSLVLKSIVLLDETSRVATIGNNCKMTDM